MLRQTLFILLLFISTWQINAKDSPDQNEITTISTTTTTPTADTLSTTTTPSTTTISSTTVKTEDQTVKRNDVGLTRFDVALISTFVPIGILVIFVLCVILIYCKRRCNSDVGGSWDRRRNMSYKLEMNSREYSKKEQRKDIALNNAVGTLTNLLAPGGHLLKSQYQELVAQTNGLRKNAGVGHDFKKVRIEGSQYILGHVLRQSRETFLHSIWDRNVSFIIMLTRTQIHGQDLCVQYWPILNSQVQLGGLSFRTVEEQNNQSYIYRKFMATWFPRSRSIHHYQFLGWRLEECPDDPKLLLDFIRRVRQDMDKHENPGPVLVHCSEDLSRTGAYVVLDQIIQEAQGPATSVNIYQSLRSLSNQCPWITFKQGQYFFIHECLKAYLETSRNSLRLSGVYEEIPADASSPKVHSRAEPYCVSVISGRSSSLSYHKDTPVALKLQTFAEESLYEPMKLRVRLEHTEELSKTGRKDRKHNDDSESDEGVYGGSSQYSLPRNAFTISRYQEC